MRARPADAVGIEAGRALETCEVGAPTAWPPQATAASAHAIAAPRTVRRNVTGAGYPRDRTATRRRRRTRARRPALALALSLSLALSPAIAAPVAVPRAAVAITRAAVAITRAAVAITRAAVAVSMPVALARAVTLPLGAGRLGGTLCGVGGGRGGRTLRALHLRLPGRLSLATGARSSLAVTAAVSVAVSVAVAVAALTLTLTLTVATAIATRAPLSRRVGSAGVDRMVDRLPGTAGRCHADRGSRPSRSRRHRDRGNRGWRRRHRCGRGGRDGRPGGDARRPRPGALRRGTVPAPRLPVLRGALPPIVRSTADDPPRERAPRLRRRGVRADAACP